MEKWVGYAVASALFAGATSVIAKLGLDGISGELGVAIRTGVVFVAVVAFSAASIPLNQLASVTINNVAWLALSGITTACSWILYYKAIKLGEVSTVVLIDKGSVVVALLLAYLLLREALTVNKLIGAALMVCGLVVIARDA